VRGAKWFTLGATYVMNTWAAYTAGSPALVVLHSVPPLVVFMAAEAVTDLRDKLAEAVAEQHSALRVNITPPEPEQETRPGTRPRSRRWSPRGAGRRTSFGEYLDRARMAYQPEVTVTPAWAREVTGCSRGLSSRLAATLTAELEGREAQP
jgi:hypothetical protein